MKLYGDQLDKLIKHFLVREYKERGIDGMNIREFLPLCAALLYPYRNETIEKDSRSEAILPIIDSVKSFAKKKRGLEKYSLNELRQYFQQNWLPTLDDNKKITLISGITLITQLEDNGYFSIKGNEKVLETYLNIPVLDISNNYGSDNFDISTEDNVINKTAEKEDNGMKNDNLDREKEVSSLAPLKEFLRSNFSLNQYPKGLYQYDYFWEYKLTGEQYENLKNILRDLHIRKRLLKEEIEGYGTIARVVALYMSEWYKREYNGNDRNNALNDIDIRYDISSSIWEKAHLPQEYLYTHSDGEGVTEWLNSIYILGGLPIRYTQTNDRFKSIINALFDIRQEGDSSEADIEEICESFDRNNKVIENALKSENGSWRQYIIRLVDYITNNDMSYLPFSESDASRPPFSEFVRSLQEGYDRELPEHFFTPEYRVWTYDYSEYGDDSGYIESEFYVHIGLHKSENVITERELTKLGVSLPAGSTTFNIRLEIEDKEGRTTCPEQCRTYFKIGNGCNDFCGVFGSDISTTIDLYTAKTISIWLESGEYKMEIHQFSVPQHIELYSTDHPYLWTTKTNHAARKVLFYNTIIYTPQNIDEQDILPKSDGISQWGWIHQNNPITLKDHEGNCTEISLGASENIIVDFRTKNLNKNVNLLSEGCVKCVIDGEEAEPIPLLYYSEGQDLIMTCDGMRGRELTQNYIIEFKPLNETYFTEWTDQNKPNQGFIILRISCRDESKKKRIWRRMVYFIPDNYPIINRNLENKFITFKGNNIIPLNETLKSYFNEQTNKFKDSYDYGLNSPTIPFRIGDDDNHIIVDVYRAFKWQQIWNQGSLIKDVIDARTAIIPVATILEKYYLLKIIDENGYHEHSTQRNPQQIEYIKDYFDSPLDIALYNNTTDSIKIQRGVTFCDTSGAFQRYIYLSRHEDISRGEMKVREIKIEKNINRRIERILLSISDKHAYKYNFYYWSGNKDERPIELNKERLGERSYCLNLPYALDGKAIVFQSLRDYIPNLYFRPIYANENWEWRTYLIRFDEIRNNMDYMISCYHFAVEHKINFSVFPALRHLQDRGRFTNFLSNYIKMKKYALLKEDFENLTRLAIELAMDWFFIDKQSFIKDDIYYYDDEEDDEKEENENKRKCLKELLHYSPIAQIAPYYSPRFINAYFDKDQNVRNGGLPRQLLKAIYNYKYYNSNYNGDYNIENRVNFLNSLINSENNIFPEICRILNI